jgi:hypothetical protein
MKLHVLLAGAAVVALSFTAASAASAAGSGKFAQPSQPVAYSKLGAYLKATPKQRARGNWGVDQTAAANAQTGTAANTSMTTTPQPGATSDQSGTAMTPPAATPPDATPPPAATPPEPAPPPTGQTTTPP